MDTEFDEEIREFLIESNENLNLLDQQIVQLEQQPQNQELISSVFRTIHSVKGTCGFFGFDILGSVTHITESILGQLRERKRELTPELITLILEAVDAVKVLLLRIEATGGEGEDETEGLREKLEAAYKSCGSANTISELLLNREVNETTPAEAVETEAEAALVEAATVIGQAAIPLELALTKAATPISLPVSEAVGETHVTDSTIRVDVNLLNQLMNLVGELVLTRNQLLQAAGNFSSGVQQTSQRLNTITTELQESVMKTRMQPIGMVWSKLPRVVRDLSAKCGKKITLDMTGAETELDRSLVEAIRDPLTHIVRNSCDHGIETPGERIAKGKPAAGTLSMRAFHEAGAVNIEIVDDGAGINPDRIRSKAVEKKLITAEYASTLSASESINLIFLPGFSTAQQVTSISGRGVGMDVVKTNIERISGSVQVLCPPSGGTCIRIKIPLTLAIIPGLIVGFGSAEKHGGAKDELFVIPQSHLVELTRVDVSGKNRAVDKINGALIFRHRGNLLPLVYLSSLLNKTEAPVYQDFVNIIILQVQGKQFGLVVDRICDTQEIVVKPLGKQLKHLPCYGGATIMGDGRPALILDVGGIAKLAELDVQHKELSPNQSLVRQNQATSEFLLFRVGASHRMAMPLTIVNRLEVLPGDSVEYAAGNAVVRYRGELLPLVAAAALVDSGAPPLATEHGNVHVIVINNGFQPFGLMVDDILDIVEESLSVVRGSTMPGLLGSAVIGGLVTDIVDVTALCGNDTETWNRSRGKAAYAPRVAFYNPWPLGAEMMYTLLDVGGFRPARIASEAELKDVLTRGEIDAVVLDCGKMAVVPDWLEHARHETGLLWHLPIIELANGKGSDGSSRGNPGARHVRVDRNDRKELLQTIARLTPALEKAA